MGRDELVGVARPHEVTDLNSRQRGRRSVEEKLGGQGKG